MRRRSSAWDRRKCETSYRWNRLRRSPSPLMACCWFPASLPSATPTTDSCLNPNGLPVPKVLGPQHNNSFINSALKSGAAVSVSKVSPASRPTCPLPRSPRNPLSLSLPPSATPIAETQMAKAEPLAFSRVTRLIQFPLAPACSSPLGSALCDIHRLAGNPAGRCHPRVAPIHRLDSRDSYRFPCSPARRAVEAVSQHSDRNRRIRHLGGARQNRAQLAPLHPFR